MTRHATAPCGPYSMLDLHPRPCTVPLDTSVAAAPIMKTLDGIIAVEGPRLPAHGQATTTWRAAFVLVAWTSKELTMEALSDMEAIRGFWPGRFGELTGGRGTTLTEFPSG